MALLVPAAEGLKVTAMAQLLPSARVAAQVVVKGKSVGFEPVIEMAMPDRVAEPVFMRMTF